MLTNTKNKVAKALNGIKQKYYAAMATGFCAVAGATNTVMAADSGAKQLMKTALDIIGKICIVPAAFFLIAGIMQYASAHSDGDGPGTKKAIGMISAGIMIAVAAAILLNGSTQETFANLLST